MDIPKQKLVEIVTRNLPYPAQISDWDFQSEESAIRFSWRGNRFRVSATLGVEEVGDSVLKGTDLALLLETLLKREVKYSEVQF